jgi:hypothetical protein
MENSIISKIKKHNDLVKREFKRAKQGVPISLTDLLIAKEKIIKDINDFN